MNEARAYSIVRERAGGRCEAAIDNVCLGEHDTTHHRRKPGRISVPSNLLAVCGDGTIGCHGWIESHPEWAMEEGLWVSHTEDPATVSAHMRWENLRSWYVLEDDGMLVWDTSEFETITLSLAAPTALLQFYRKGNR